MSAQSIRSLSKTTEQHPAKSENRQGRCPEDCPLWLDNWAELRQHTPMDTIRMQLKTLNWQQSLYAKTKTMMKNNLIALLDQTYPGVNALFDSPVREDGSQKWVDFATAFWHVDCVRNMSLTAFAERYRKWCKRHGYNFSQSKAVEVHTGAQDLIAMLLDALTKTMVRQAIDALNAVSASLETAQG